MAEEVMATITIGYKTYCVSIDAAVILAKTLTTAEVYELKYRTDTDGGPTHHIYPNDDKIHFQLNLITADLYRMAKLAGKPKG